MSHGGFAGTLVVALLGSLAPASEPPTLLERFGIGATLVHYDSLGTVVVDGCFANGPADRAGLRARDRLVELNGRPIAGWSFAAVLESLRADGPLPIRLSVERGAEPLEFLIVRARLSDVAAGAGIRYVLAPDSSLGWIAVPLHEREPVAIGDVLRLEGLKNKACAEAPLPSEEGRATLLYFWATWCGWCKSMFPRLATVDSGRAASEINLLGINVDDTCEQFQQGVADLRPPGAQVWGGGYYQGELAQAVGVHRRGLPTAALLDGQGRLVEVVAGSNRIIELFERVRGKGGP